MEGAQGEEMQKQIAAQKQQQEKQAMAKEQRSAMMSQVLESDARVRLANIAAVKPEKAEILENIIITNVQ